MLQSTAPSDSAMAPLDAVVDSAAAVADTVLEVASAPVPNAAEQSETSRVEGGPTDVQVSDAGAAEAAAPTASEVSSPFRQADSDYGWWDALAGAISDLSGLSVEAASGWMKTLLLILVLWAVRHLILAAVRRRTQDVRTRYRWRKTSSYVAVGIGVVGLFSIWVASIGSLATFLGLLTAGVAIALKDPLVNLAGWMFVLWRKPFSPGDRIALRDHVGDVIDQRLFAFTILEVGTATGAGQSTGRIIHIPNGWVFTDSVVNYTGAFAYVWHEIAVVVTFESDWRGMKEILFDVAETKLDTMSEDAERTLRRAARDYLIFYSKLTPTVYTSVVGEGVQLTLRFLVSPRRIRGTEETIWEAVLDALDARDDIDLAYPTVRHYDNRREGKPETGGPASGVGAIERGQE